MNCLIPVAARCERRWQIIAAVELLNSAVGTEARGDHNQQELWRITGLINRAPRLFAHLALSAACLFWAGNMVVARMLAESMGGWHVVAGRCLASALLFWLLLKWVEPQQRLQWRPWGIGLFMAITGVVGYQGLLYFGVRMTSVINTSLIHATAPLVTLLMAALVLRAPVGRVQLAAAVVSFLGILVIVTEGSWRTMATLSFSDGDLLIMLATVSFAAYSIAGRRVMSQRSVLEVTTLITIWAALIAMPLAGWEGQSNPASWNTQAFLGLAYITIFPGVLAMLAWNYAIKVVGPADAMLYMNTVPVIAVLMSVLFLGEQLQFTQALGGLLVLAGCLASVVVGAGPKRAAD